MSLSDDLVKKFVIATRDEVEDKKSDTAYGTVSVMDGRMYVRLDGSDILTPIEYTSMVENGERVLVRVSNHSATITGNFTSPAARQETVLGVESSVYHKLTVEELTAVHADLDIMKSKLAQVGKLEAVEAYMDELYSEYGSFDYISAKNLNSVNAAIQELTVKLADIETLEVVSAEIDQLKGYNATFAYLSTDRLSADEANIKNLEVTKLDAESADLRYANIDFANINMAAVQKLFTDSGIIKDLVVSEGHITGELVGVTIKGDIIEGNTVKADKLVVLGENGLYYKLNVNAVGEAKASSDEKYQNGLDGSAIIAKSITADRILVTDLVAFGATIGGFHIGDHSIYSGVKSSVDNTTRGIYMDDQGQFSLGDQNSFFKYYKNDHGQYKLELGMSLGSRNYIRNSKTAIYELYNLEESYEKDHLVYGEKNLTYNGKALYVGG